MAEQEERIRVAVRVRPVASANDAGGESAKEVITVLPDQPDTVVVYTDSPRQQAATFRCETFLPPTASQPEVFDQLRINELVEAALDGFPVTIFAYGQTGAGKSFTIFGKEDGASAGTNGLVKKKKPTGSVRDTDGLMPRTAAHLMDVIAARKDQVEYTLRVTCVEIYNEQVRDVFDPRKESLTIRSSKQHGFFLENATVVECASAPEIIKVVKAAAANRARSSHLLNDCSNRSHCLITIYIDAVPVDGDNNDAHDAQGKTKTYGKLTIVDLAGSERVVDTGAAGIQLRETAHINKSLYCLNKVIQAMNSKVKGKFVPYRDSKLTMLLLDSLGGNSKTLMIACVNGAPQFATESVRTLEFAMGVAKIKNRPAAVLNPHEKLICALREQIRLLKIENEMLRARTPGYFVEHGDPDVFSMDTSRTASSRPGSEIEAITTRFDTSKMTNKASGSRMAVEQHSTDPTSLFIRRERGPQGFVQKVRMHRAATTEDSTRKNNLKLLKSKQHRRSQDNAHRKQLSKHTKPKKRAPVSVSVPDFSSLPPVFSKMAPPLERYILPPPTPPAVVESTFSRSASPPPGYDDLFGIETVPVGPTLQSSRSTASIKLEALPHTPTTSHRKVVAHPVVAMQTKSPNQEPAHASLAPEDQLQQLLAQITGSTQRSNQVVPPHRPAARLQKAAAPPPRTHQPTTGSVQAGPVSSQHWDDDRAHDLFLQLCSLQG